MSDHLSLASLPCTVMTTGDGPEGAGAGAGAGLAVASAGGGAVLVRLALAEEELGPTVGVERCEGNVMRPGGTH